MAYSHGPFGQRWNYPRFGYRGGVDEEAVTQDGGEAEEAEPDVAQAERGTWDDPRVPWSGRPRRVDILCWAGIVLSGIYYWALLPFVAPLVGTHPVLLEVLK